MHRKITVVGQSEIHGKGLFAKSVIRRGEKIGAYEGRRTQRNGMHVLWLEDDSGDCYGINGRNELRFLNHSTKPNAEFAGEELWSLRKIREGEEITFHYGDDWDDQ